MEPKVRKVKYNATLDTGLPYNEGLYSITGNVSVKYSDPVELLDKLKKYVQTKESQRLGFTVELWQLTWEFAEEETIV